MDDLKLRITKVKAAIAVLEAKAKINEAEKQKLSQMRKEAARLERTITAGKKKAHVSRTKKNPKQPKLNEPGQPVHDVPINMIDYNDLMTPPPNGHLGVYFVRQSKMAPLHKVRFYYAHTPEETVKQGTVLFIEPPGPSCRPDVNKNSKCLTHYKIHWVPIN